MKFSFVLAVDDKDWLWKNNELAWKLPWDVKFFKKITSETKDLSKFNAVVMWRKTWESIPSKFRPLPNRINCVLSRTLKTHDTLSEIDDFVIYNNSFDNCLNELSKRENIADVFVIWWANLYNQLLEDPNLDKIYLTKVKWDFDCDVFFGWVPDDFEIDSQTEPVVENGIEYSIFVYKKKYL